MRGELDAVDDQESLPVAEKFVIETPSAGEICRRPETRFIESPIVALIQQMQNPVFIQQQVGFACSAFAGYQACSQFVSEYFDSFGNPPDIRARPLGIFHLLAPDRLAFDEFVAQGFPLQTSVLGQERDYNRRTRRRPAESRAQTKKGTPCTFNCTAMYIGLYGHPARQEARIADSIAEIHRFSRCIHWSIMKSESGGFKELLKNGGFQGFLWTQFLGALNDNLYKMIVSMRAVHVAASTGTEYVAIALAVFVIPFFLFSGYSGQLADRLSKRSVLIGVKIFEIGVMLGGIAVFFSTRIEWMLVILFLMALHSTIFSPAKYGIVPEMLPDKDLSRANALLEMTTFVAIVMGTSLGALLFNAWKSTPWKMGVVMLGVAVVGFPDQPSHSESEAQRGDGSVSTSIRLVKW